MAVNKVILIGNVGKDPEVQYVKEDVPVARFSLATSETYKNKAGERVTETEWHNIVVWRGLAKVVEKYVKKGTKLFIEGKLTNRKYEKDGQTRYFTEIVANELKMLDKASGENNGEIAGNNVLSNMEQDSFKATDIVIEQEQDDDLPF